MMEQSGKSKVDKVQDLVWVNKRFLPNDPRYSVPVPRYKYLLPDKLPEVPHDWKRPTETPIFLYSRHLEEFISFIPSPATASKEWSTLRQMLPSRGIVKKQQEPRWGTGKPSNPSFTLASGNRFPFFGSPMTRYVDDMYVTNKLYSFQ